MPDVRPDEAQDLELPLLVKAIRLRVLLRMLTWFGSSNYDSKNVGGFMAGSSWRVRASRHLTQAASRAPVPLSGPVSAVKYVEASEAEEGVRTEKVWGRSTI